MPLSIPRSLVEHILLGPIGDRRQLQDSPVLADVWIAFAENPALPQEVLLTPHRDHAAGYVATQMDELLHVQRAMQKTLKAEPAEIAALQGIVAARLYFWELLMVVVPLTRWWKQFWTSDVMHRLNSHPGATAEKVKQVSDALADWLSPGSMKRQYAPFTALERYIVLAGIILWSKDAKPLVPDERSQDQRIADTIRQNVNAIADTLLQTFNMIERLFYSRNELPGALVHEITLNRPISMALDRSVASVKADAVHGLFKVDTSRIGWAVVDSGIHGSHPAFTDGEGRPRVLASYDFSRFRRIVSLDNRRIFKAETKKRRLDRLNQIMGGMQLKDRPPATVAEDSLIQLSEDLANDRPRRWELILPFIEIKTETRPINDHGTHVAGIIGAKKVEGIEESSPGMCPDIKLYDLRVLSEDLESMEFGVIAALEFIRYKNQVSRTTRIHGANLSLSIPHDVRNYACGRTPVCDECERLVESGVVVVAAAGNRGYQSFTTKEGAFDSYAALSITDPGNAESVITVGSTHRTSPHTYGVSFFSSRGPTGDGRSKPDLVAPGERIVSTFCDGNWGELDGTSMAAPHVSGAAALLLSRYGELVGRPRRIKEVLCESATDLGRERAFQGNGMLDVLRAFQKL
jgi:hypothetical protein